MEQAEKYNGNALYIYNSLLILLIEVFCSSWFDLFLARICVRSSRFIFLFHSNLIMIQDQNERTFFFIYYEWLLRSWATCHVCCK